jgi:hypothetical protein
VIVGFRNLEPKSIDAFEIIDTIPVTLDDEGYLVALEGPRVACRNLTFTWVPGGLHS